MNVTVAEFAVVSGALALFVVVPAALALVAARRRADAVAPTDVPTLAGPFSPDSSGEGVTFPDAALAEPLPPAGLPAPRPWPRALGPGRTFQLRALRDASSEVVPAHASFLDRSPGARAEIMARRGAWERIDLRGPVDPAAYAIVGIERAGDDAQIVALLFSELWPDSETGAVARAVFRISADGSIASAAVEPV